MEEPRILKLSEIKNIVDSKAFEQFKNCVENEFFEAKQKYPYDLDSKAGIVEMSCDVAEIANSCEGYIFLGLKTVKHPSLPHDIVTDIDYFEEKDLYAKDKIIGILKERIYPKIDGLEVIWIPSNNVPNKGIGVIHIPKQEKNKKYFIVSFLNYNEENIKGVYYGIPIRNDDTRIWLKASDIYNLSKKAPSDLQSAYKDLSVQINDIKELILRNTRQVKKETSLDRIKEVLYEH